MHLVKGFLFRINSRIKGRIIITAEELDSSKDVVFMKWNGKKLDKKDFFGKSDPFMVFCRCNEDNRCVCDFVPYYVMFTNY